MILEQPRDYVIPTPRNLQKEVSRGSFHDAKFTDKAWQMLEVGGPTATALGSIDFLMPRKGLIQMLLWLGSDHMATFGCCMASENLQVSPPHANETDHR